jgi:hypothetical protein
MMSVRLLGAWVCTACHLVIELLTSGDPADESYWMDCPECGAVAEFRSGEESGSTVRRTQHHGHGPNSTRRTSRYCLAAQAVFLRQLPVVRTLPGNKLCQVMNSAR